MEGMNRTRELEIPTDDTAADVPGDAAVSQKKTGRGYRRIMEWLIVFVLIYIGWCALLYFMQDSMMFPRAYAMGMSDHRTLYDNPTRLARPHEDGEVEAMLLLAPNATAETPAPLVVFCHGNGETIDFLTDDVQGYHDMGVSVLLPEYRGYGRSAGKPTQDGIVDDVTHFTKQAVENPAVDADRLIYHGRSLGGGVATAVAMNHRPAAIILQSTFVSMASMSKTYFVPQFLVKHPFRNDLNIETLKGVKLLIAHGTVDPVIPFTHFEQLTAIRPDAKTITFKCDHNGFPGIGNDQAYWDAIAAMLTDANLIEAFEPHAAAK